MPYFLSTALKQSSKLTFKLLVLVLLIVSMGKIANADTQLDDISFFNHSFSAGLDSWFTRIGTTSTNIIAAYPQSIQGTNFVFTKYSATYPGSTGPFYTGYLPCTSVSDCNYGMFAVAALTSGAQHNLGAPSPFYSGYDNSVPANGLYTLWVLNNVSTTSIPVNPPQVIGHMNFLYNNGSVGIPLSTRFNTLTPSQKTVPSGKVDISFNYTLGQDDIDGSSLRYDTICFTLENLEPSSTPVAFTNSVMPHCYGGGNNSLAMPTDKYIGVSDIPFTGNDGITNLKLPDGEYQMLLSIQSNDGSFVGAATSTEFIVGTSTVASFPQDGPQTSDSVNNINCVIDLNQYDSGTIVQKAETIFQVGLCDSLNPKSKDLNLAINNLVNGPLSYPPWGYVTRFAVLMSTTSTSSLPTIDIPVQWSSTSTSTLISIDPNETLTGAGILLNSIHDPFYGKTFQDAAEPIIKLIFALSALTIIIFDLVGMAKTNHLTHFSDQGNKHANN